MCHTENVKHLFCSISTRGEPLFHIHFVSALDQLATIESVQTGDWCACCCKNEYLEAGRHLRVDLHNV